MVNVLDVMFYVLSYVLLMATVNVLYVLCYVLLSVRLSSCVLLSAVYG